MPNHEPQDQLLDHSYDGIQEFDNPMPRWWVYLFWVTIVFSVLYWFNVPAASVPIQPRSRVNHARIERSHARHLSRHVASSPSRFHLQLASGDLS